MTNVYKYYTLEQICYYSKRYNNWIIVEKGYPTDGATGAKDILGPIKCIKIEDYLDFEVDKGETIHLSKAFIVHDKICDTGMWEDRTPISNWQASQVLQDILKSEGRYIRAKTWFWMTWLNGGGKARENGMW